MTRRKVVVAMPYGEAGAEYRKAILNFSRLKYIIQEKCQVVPPGPGAAGMRVAYDVEIAKTATDQISRRALEKIRSADILIALLSERNQTVAYELGYYRRGRERTVILMVDEANDVLPVYEKSFAYQVWKQDEVLNEIDSIAGRNFPPLDDFDVVIPGGLKDVIDARDNGLITNLQLALQEIEQDFGSVWFPDAVEMLRGILIKRIDRFYPFSVVEVRFSKRGEFDDPPLKVVDFDDDFSRLYGYGGIDAARQDTPHTFERLLARIKKYSDPDDWEEFLQDQNTLVNAVKDYTFARASVPIRFNSSHPYEQFRNKSFLPAMTAQVADDDSDRDGPHRNYLLIAYIELYNGIAHTSTRGEG
jgi:nucleoside 2-deoxyribosyltransferase